jgi:hypothetical protein
MYDPRKTRVKKNGKKNYNRIGWMGNYAMILGIQNKRRQDRKKKSVN